MAVTMTTGMTDDSNLNLNDNSNTISNNQHNNNNMNMNTTDGFASSVTSPFLQMQQQQQQQQQQVRQRSNSLNGIESDAGISYTGQVPPIPDFQTFRNYHNQSSTSGGVTSMGTSIQSETTGMETDGTNE
jgi:hypothetical protein